jgi:hypothetical protein
MFTMDINNTTINILQNEICGTLIRLSAHTSTWNPNYLVETKSII